jgi:hypothetical protein
VQRDGAGITWSGEGDSASIQLAPLADAAASQAGDQRRLAEALAQYPKWRDVYAYRMKASKWLLPAALLSLCASLLVGRIPRWRAARWPYLVLISGWALLLVVLPVYFGT